MSKTLVSGLNELNVELKAPLGPIFYMPSYITADVGEFDPYWGASVHLSCPISNIGDKKATRTVSWGSSIIYEGEDPLAGSRSITIKPGETYIWTFAFNLKIPIDFTLTGNWEGNNIATVHIEP